MIMGVRVILKIPQAYSLKEKRRILSSLLNRIRQKFQVTCCELMKQDYYNLTEIEIAYCGNKRRHIEQVLNQCINWIEGNYPVEITNIEWS